MSNDWTNALDGVPVPGRPIEVVYLKDIGTVRTHEFDDYNEVPSNRSIVKWRYTDTGSPMLEDNVLSPSEGEERTVVHNKVGDIHSTAKGSGARYNEGKPDLSQIPLHLLAHTGDAIPTWLATMLNHVSEFQFKAGQDFANLNAALKCIPDAYREAAHVFSYGEKKYAKYNWMKGMAWSVPLACIGRHALYIIEGEEIDPESGRLHAGHIACNIIMLLHYNENYLEGDDRPCLAQ
jgi:hypothetical protein